MQLYEAQKKINSFSGAEVQKLPEFESMMRKKHSNSNGLESFFAFFGYRGRYVSAEESDAAWAKEREKRERIKRGEKEPEPEAKDENMDDGADVEAEAEIFEFGEELAISIAEDLWPSAIKYWSKSKFTT